MRQLLSSIRMTRVRQRLTSGVTQISGFAFAVLMLGVVSLVSVPAMVAAGGAVAWGAIALGQAVGLVGNVFVVYGWNRSGPAQVARAGSNARRREYLDSIRVKAALVGPTSIVAALVASLLVPEGREYAAAGAVVATLNGLTAIWYFAGVAQSYRYFLLEALPRALGTVAGIALLRSGFSVYVGLACMGAGILIGFLVTTVWIYRSTASDSGELVQARGLGELLWIQREGVISTVVSAAYIALPLAIVSVLAPAAQPAMALADKMFRQFLVAIGPVVTVIQGWVPRAPVGPARVKRAHSAIAASFALASMLGGALAIFGGSLSSWLGDGQITLTNLTIVLVAVLIGLSVLDAVLGNAVLAALDKLDLAVRATYLSAAIGLPLIAIGAHHFGVGGALGGLVVGLTLRIVIELAGLLLHERHSSIKAVQHTNGNVTDRARDRRDLSEEENRGGTGSGSADDKN